MCLVIKQSCVMRIAWSISITLTHTHMQVVQELECMVSDLRLEYDEQLVELQEQLVGKDLELAALREQLLQVQ